MGRCINCWHQSTIERHSLSHAHSGVPAPSEREPGTVRFPPAPSLRELSSECETEGVYYDERIRSKISEFIMVGG